MENDERLKDCPLQLEVANDNGKNASRNIAMDEAVFRLARLLGRQIAREHFAAMQAANDNNDDRAPKFEN